MQSNNVFTDRLSSGVNSLRAFRAIIVCFSSVVSVNVYNRGLQLSQKRLFPQEYAKRRRGS